MRKLVCSSSVKARHEALFPAIESPDPGVLLIAPSRGAADDFLLVASQGSGAFGVEKRTLFNLAMELSAPRLCGAAPVSALGVEAIAALITTDAHDQGQLETLHTVASMPGFPRALGATLADLRAAGVGSEDLEAQGDAELAFLLASFETELETWQLADEARIYGLATDSLEGAPHRWSDWSFVLLEPEIRSGIQRDFLAAILASVERVSACVGRGHAEGTEFLRTLLEKKGSCDFLDLDHSEIVRSRPDDLDSAPESVSPLGRAQRDLFSSELDRRPVEDAPQDQLNDEVPTVPSEASGEVILFSAAAEGQECVEIARRIRDLAREGVAFDRMAIVVRDAEGYMPLLEDAMQRAGIPTYFSRGTSRPDPGGRAFLALLACATEDLSASRFAEYLSLAQVPRQDVEPEQPVKVPWVASAQTSLFGDATADLASNGVSPTGDDLRDESASLDVEQEADESRRTTLPAPARWERILVDAAVVGGRDRWQRRLAGRRGELELQARQISDEDRARRPGLELELRQLRHLEQFALPLITRLDELPGAGTWGFWIGVLEELAVASLHRPETVLSLLAELRPMRDVGPVTLIQVQQVLSERLSMLRREPPKRRYGCVFVGLLEELAGRTFDSVFLPGMAEGVFPRRAFEDPLLPDQRRRSLSARLPGQRQRLSLERLLLHLAVEASESRLVVSYPRVDAARGRASVPSFYALDLLRAAEGGLPDLQAISRRAASASTTAVGWAVPKVCEDAIDDAEFDLALLRPLLQSEGGGKGQGRFLLLSNRHLERSLRARARRWRRPFTSADGLVVDAESEALDVLAKHHPRARSFSPTALQNFSACPYRFFLQAVQRLRPREEMERLEELDPLTRGSIFHEIQFEILSRLRDRELLPLTVDNQEEALDLLDTVVDELVPRFAEDLAPAIDRVWVAEMDGVRNDLRGWIGQLAQGGGRWTPRHFELAFGLPHSESRDPESVPEAVEVMAGIQLRGAIDMIEVDRSGAKLRVTDHKTGAFRGHPRLVVGKGEVLQPVLYALVAESLLASEDTAVVAGRLSYCTQRGGYEDVQVDLNPESRAAAEKVLDTVAESLEEGFLPALPRRDACVWCDYQTVCGPYEELRARGKDWRKPLPKRLLEVRRQN